jgi:glycyl-tRNA synthetase beta chain
VRWLVAMLDSETVPLEFDGAEAGKRSEGHRILSSGAVTLASPSAYKDDLLAAHVVADPAEREHRVRKALDSAWRTIPGARWREDKELLETVVNLTEFPSVIAGSFDHSYLTLPEEVLVTVMRDHQKYFAVEDAEGKLAPHFLTVLNTFGDPQGLIRHGNERVLRARFNDARFFWNTDQKHNLRERVNWLKNVTFQKDLGSYYDKTMRVQKLASQICEWICAPDSSLVRPGVVHKAALLAKADLTTELVKEFTELQGIVGGLYARAQELDSGLPEATRFAIADAIYDQYKPESMDDAVPHSMEGAVLSIADKADSIAGMFALGLIPSGSKDPFALRRQANGIVRIIAEHKLNLSIADLFNGARETYAGSEAEKKFSDGYQLIRDAMKMKPGVPIETTRPELIPLAGFALAIQSFFRERLEFYLRDARGFAYDVVNAVLAAGSDDVVDVIARAEAVSTVRGSEDFQAIGTAFKRIKNILRQAGEKHVEISQTFSADGAAEEAERQLGAVMAQATKAFAEKTGDYVGSLKEIARLRQPIDAFFDKVMVMVDDPKVRANRLALLRDLLYDFSVVADFSEIVTERK